MIERYTLPRMGKIWEPQYRFQKWLEIEISVCEAMAKEGMIPAQSIETIKERAAFSVERIDEIEKEAKHDVIAFLTNLEESIGPDARYVHLGLTSSDILDTALALQLKEAMLIIIEDLQGLLDVLKGRAFEHKNTAMIGRSHGIHAEPTTFGLKLALWHSEMRRNMTRLEQALEVISYGKISGAVGTFANISPRIEEYVCAQLGLKPAEVSTQVIQRDRHAQYFTSLGILAGSIEKIALEIRHLQRTEVGEVEEAFAPGQKGSSAMPHKKNPITAERITGIARLLRGYAVTAMENVPLWHERDIAHSSVERVIIPDACMIIDYGLQKFLDLLKGLVINEKRMIENIFYGGGVVFSQRLLLMLTDSAGSREIAYRLVQQHGIAANAGNGLFRELVKHDPEILKYLSASQIDSCFDLSYYTAHVNTIFRRVFGR
jgi:adenylosuccinate lyase